MTKRYEAPLLHLFISGKKSIVETTHGTFEGEIRNLDDEGYVVMLDDKGDLIMLPKDSVKVIKVEKAESSE